MTTLLSRGVPETLSELLSSYVVSVYGEHCKLGHLVEPLAAAGFTLTSQLLALSRADRTQLLRRVGASSSDLTSACALLMKLAPAPAVLSPPLRGGPTPSPT
eukprot:RCo032586